MDITNTNFLQPSGFRIVINRKRFPNLQYFVQGVSHPSVDIAPAQGSYSRLASVDQIGDKLEFGSVTFNIMLDEEMSGYSEMFDWMHRLVNENFVPKFEATATNPSSEHDITLIVLNSSNVEIKKITYRNAFPVSIGEISMESTAADPQPISVPVTFRYLNFTLN